MLDYYNKRHWYQLTEILIAATFGKDGEPTAAFDNLDLKAFYSGFVQFFETKISPTSLVRFVAAAANRNICISDPPTTEQVVAAQALLDGLADTDTKKNRLGAGACAYLQHERLSLSVRCGGGALMNVSLFIGGGGKILVQNIHLTRVTTAPFANLFSFSFFALFFSLSPSPPPSPSSCKHNRIWSARIL